VTVGLAAIVAKTVIWLFTFVFAGPLVALLWRTLADALRTLAGLDMVVPGAVPVHFLFPVWDPAVDRDHSRVDVTSVLFHMQLPLEPRLRRLQRLGATAGGPVPGLPAEAAAYGLRDIAAAGGWLSLGALLLAVLLALSVLGAAGVLYLLGWMLDAVLVTLPGWITRQLA
jgi:hypothetical protein